MRQLSIAALVSLAACAATPPRALPQAAWTTRADAVYVLVADANDTDANKATIKSDIEEDLQAAGFRVETGPKSAGELKLQVTIEGGYSTTTVLLEQDGQQLDRFTFDWLGLPCNSITSPSSSLHCVAREVVARIVESKAVASRIVESSVATAPPVQAKQLPATAHVASAAAALSGKLAVLELRNFTKDLTHENAQYFTDMLRSAALKAQPQLEVMTRENLVVLLQASGKRLEECEGECEVETGRRIGADLIISGELQKLGSLYKLSLRLHDTHEGRLLASTQASGKTIEELDESAQAAAEKLVAVR